ncbi:MAG: EI24 domain-containing protein [Pseudomonadota bacterium]
MAVGLILQSFLKALWQLSDQRFQRVLFIGILLTLALLLGVTAGVLLLINWITPEDVWLPVLGEVSAVKDLVSWGAFFLLILLSIFLMVPVASAITSLFLEDVATSVEDRHYPAASRARSVSFGEGLRDTVNFLGVIIVANAIAIIFYVIFSPAAIFIFWGLNGYLLGREYFTMTAMRRHNADEVKRLRKKHSSVIWLAGILMTVPLSVPLINLIIPILGAATFTHLYHGLVESGRQTSSPPHPR